MTTAGASNHNIAAMTKAMNDDERAWLKARRDRQLALVAGAEKSSRDFAIRTCTHCGGPMPTDDNCPHCGHA